jgi:hypothetical protein
MRLGLLKVLSCLVNKLRQKLMPHHPRLKLPRVLLKPLRLRKKLLLPKKTAKRRRPTRKMMTPLPTMIPPILTQMMTNEKRKSQRRFFEINI